jgi:hypothetical protein
MRKLLFPVLAATTVAVATIASPSPADARCRGCGVAAGLIGGLAAGALIGSAVAANPPPPRVYYAEPLYEPVCRLERRRVWIDDYHWHRRWVEVCD